MLILADVVVKCQWLSRIDSNFGSDERDNSKVIFYWRDSRSPEKGFLPVCWRSFTGSRGGCNDTFIYPDHQFSASSNDTLLIKSIKYTGDVMCKFKVHKADTLSTKRETVTVKGKLSIILYKQTNCYSER